MSAVVRTWRWWLALPVVLLCVLIGWALIATNSFVQFFSVLVTEALGVTGQMIAGCMRALIAWTNANHPSNEAAPCRSNPAQDEIQ